MYKRKKYINYIVDDMVKNTKISFIKICSENIVSHIPHIYTPFVGEDPYVIHDINGLSPRLFSKHLHNVYGVNKDDYTFIIFCMYLYKEKLKPLVVYKNVCVGIDSI